MPCLSPVVTDFPEISRKFEGLRLELVSRNFALVQQKDGPGPSLTRVRPGLVSDHVVCVLVDEFLFANLHDTVFGGELS